MPKSDGYCPFETSSVRITTQHPPYKAKIRAVNRKQTDTSFLNENELITAEPAAAGLQPRKLKSFCAVNMEHVLGAGHFERIPAHPINYVPPGAHAAILAVGPPRVKRAAAKQIATARWPLDVLFGPAAAREPAASREPAAAP